MYYTTKEEMILGEQQRSETASYAHSPGYQQGAKGIAEITPEQLKSGALLSQVGGSHYTDMAIQPIEYILANDIPFPEGNVIKYVSRWRAKGGVKDLEKAVHHLKLLIEYENTGAEEAKSNRKRRGR